MSNSFDSNITSKLAKQFVESFESVRVLSKNVNTQFLENAFDPSTGDTVSIKRPTDYKTSRTSDGDISGGTAQSIITGKASATVQDYFTVELDWQEADQAIKMDQLEELIAPAATRIATDLELDFASFMMKNSALVSGAPGTPVTTWDHVAESGALMASSGIPQDSMWNYAVNPYTQRKLAGLNKALGAGGSAGSEILAANRRAVIDSSFAGMEVRTATSLANYTTHSGADRAGTLSGNPTVTYLGAKDSLTQVLAVTAFQANLQVRAGETIQITGRNRLNLSTRQAIIDDTGSPVVFTATVKEAVTLNGSGAGNITISGAAIYEADGAYNTVDSAPISGDVVTLLGSASSIIQPNMFWHKNAFTIGSVPIAKLYSTDTLGKTADGLQIRCSKGASIRENKQIVRFDIRPAFGVNNPFFAGQSFG